MKKPIVAILSAILLMALVTTVVAVVVTNSRSEELPIDDLFRPGFLGYTTDEEQVQTADFVSSKPISVTEGEDIWFGPCIPAQYFQLVGQDVDGKAVTDKIRGKDLTVEDKFNNGMVIYKYTVPAGVSRLVFSADADLAKVYTVSKKPITELTWRAYWSQRGEDPDAFVGESSYYEVIQGDKLYFGAITETDALESKIYDANGVLLGNIAKSDLRLVENFGGAYGIYCYTVPKDAAYVYVAYDADYEQYYFCKAVAKSESITDQAVTSEYIAHIGVALPLDSTVAALEGKSVLFLGDSITFGARDRACIYGSGGWAGRIGHFAGMEVTNNGVSGACITTARRESNSEAHYIYNNLIKTDGTQYDYVIMHGLFNDASEKVAVGTMQGKDRFDPAKADVTSYAGALELLFYQARIQDPDAILGFIVNFQTERSVNQAPYVEMAIRVCEDWGIEYLDLYHQEGFSVEFDDGLHPSSAGYDSMYTVVANWMAGLDGDITTVPAAPTEVMSYNVFWDSDIPADKGLSIEDRYLKVAELIKTQSSDIIMLQEHTGSFDIVARSVLSEYSFYGISHTATSDEQSPIAWKTAKYDLVASGTFWASDTPEVAYSDTWCKSEKSYPRAINWVVLKDKQTGEQLLAMNVHGQPNNENADARTKTMALVAAKASELSERYGDIATVIGGDMNMGIGSDAYDALTAGGLKDVRAWIDPKAIGSFNDWDREQSKFAMGDYLFIGGDVNALSFVVFTDDMDNDREDGKDVLISDHCPVIAEIYF